MKRHMTLYLVVVLMLGAQCAFAPQAKVKGSKDRPQEEVVQIEDFDPLSLGEDDAGVPEATEPVVGRQKDELPAVPSEPEATRTMEQVQGYRVQIFVSSSLESAQAIVAEAEAIFPGEVYLQYDAPYYKVRVGNCLTRREGDLLQERAVRRGYRDAWVVRSLVSPRQE